MTTKDYILKNPLEKKNPLKVSDYILPNSILSVLPKYTSVFGKTETGAPSLLESQYTSGYRPTLGFYEELQAQRQSNWAKIGSGIAQGLASIPLTITQGSSVLLDPDFYSKLLTGHIDQWKNSVFDTMDEANKYIKEIIPIYRTEASKGFAFTSSGWWAELFPSAISSAAIMIPGYGMAKGLSLLGKLAGGAKLTKGAAEIFGVAAPKLAQSLELGSASVFSRFIEQTLQGLDAGKNWKLDNQNLLKKVNPETKELYTDKDLDKMAGEIINSTFYSGLPLAVLDMIELTTIFKGYKGYISARKASIEGITGKALKRFSIGKDLSIEMITEGTDEFIQAIQQKEAEYDQDVKTGKSVPQSFNSRMSDYLKDGEIWTQAFGGAFGGALMFMGGKLLARQQNRIAERTQIEAINISTKLEAALRGDKESFNKASDKEFMQGIIAHIQDGTIDTFVDEMEKLLKIKENDLNDEDKDSYKRLKSRIETAKITDKAFYDILEDTSVPVEAKPIKLSALLDQKLTQARINHNKEDLQEIFNEDIKGGFNPALTELKKLQVEYLNLLDDKRYSKEQKEVLGKKLDNAYKAIIITDPKFENMEVQEAKDKLSEELVTTNDKKITSLILAISDDTFDLEEAKRTIREIQSNPVKAVAKMKAEIARQKRIGKEKIIKTEKERIDNENKIKVEKEKTEQETKVKAEKEVKEQETKINSLVNKIITDKGTQNLTPEEEEFRRNNVEIIEEKLKVQTTPTTPITTKKADIERRRQEELNNLGQKQVTHNFERLEEDRNKSPKTQLSIIGSIELAQKAGAKLTKEQQNKVDSIKAELKKQGYEVVDLLNTILHEGTKVINEVVQASDENTILNDEQIKAVEQELENRSKKEAKLRKAGASEEVIKKELEIQADTPISVVQRIIKPQVTKDGKLEQAAEVATLIIEANEAQALIDKSKLAKKESYSDKINAKYDAELAALEEIIDSFDKELHTKIEKRLRELYPEIKLEYTDDYLKNVEDPNILFQFSKKARQEFENILKKYRPELIEKNLIEETLNQIEIFAEEESKGNEKQRIKLEKLAIHWIIKSNLILPEDGYKIIRAEKIASIKGIDTFSIDNPNELIEKFTDEIKGEPINPDIVPELTNKKTISEYNITYYDVENTEAGRIAVRKIIDTHFGKNSNPWCLIARIDNDITKSSNFWFSIYSGITKGIAFQNGKLIAFRANSENQEKWWDRMDDPFDGIPVIIKMEDRKKQKISINSVNGQINERKTIFRGNTEQGKYEQWYENGQLNSENNYKDGEKEGIQKYWYKNGQLESKINYKNGKRDGVQKYGYDDSQLRSENNYKDDKQDGVQKYWHKNGQLNFENNYKDGKREGIQRTWYENGQLNSENNYKNSKKEGIQKYWNENGQLKFEDNYKDGKQYTLLSQIYKGHIIGQADINAMSVLIDAVHQKQDTLPHEYAHHYIRWNKNTPIVQEGIKRFGSEEALVQKIGEQSVKQKGEAWDWWTKFYKWFLNLLSDEQILGILTDAFLTRTNLNNVNIFNKSDTELTALPILESAEKLTEEVNPDIEDFNSDKTQQELSLDLIASTDKSPTIVSPKGTTMRVNRNVTVVNAAYSDVEYTTIQTEKGEKLETKYTKEGHPFINPSTERLSLPIIKEDLILELRPDITYEHFDKLKGDVNTIPIGAYLGDVLQFHVHDPNWINKNIADDAKSDVLAQTNKIRKIVFDKFNSKDETKTEIRILNISRGILSTLDPKLENKGYINSIIEAFGIQDKTQLNKFGNVTLGIAKSEISLFDINDKIINEKLKKGFIYAILPVRGEKIAIPIKILKIKELNQSDVIIQVLKDFFNKKEQKLNGYNTAKVSDLFDFLSELIYIGGKKEKADWTFDYWYEERKGITLYVGSGFIKFHGTSDQNIKILEENTELIKSILNNKTFNISKNKLINNSKFSIFKVENKNIVTDITYDNYSDFLAQKVLKTNIFPIIHPDTRTYFYQSIIEYGLNDFNDPNEPKISALLPENKKSSPLEEVDLLGLAALTKQTENKEHKEDLDDLFSSTINFSPIFKPSLEPQTFDLHQYIAKDITLTQQDEIINSLSLIIFDSAEKGETPAFAFDKIYNALINQYNKLNKESQRAKNILSVINNWNQSKEFIGYKNLIEIKLNSLALSITENFEDEESLLVKNYSEFSTFKVNPKTTASFKLKKLIAFIPITKNEQKVHSIIGTPVFYDFNEVYNDIITNLADLEFNEMIPALEELAIKNPDYSYIINKLKSLDSSILNEFKSNFRKRYDDPIEFEFDIISSLSKGKSFKETHLRIQHSNNNSIIQTLQQKWTENLKSSDIISIKDGNLIINSEKAKTLLNKFKTLAKSKEFFAPELEKLKSLFEKVGIKLDLRALIDLKKRIYVTLQLTDGTIINQKNPNLKYENIQKFLYEKVIHLFEAFTKINNFEDTNPFKEESSIIKILASVQKKYETQIRSSSYIDASGNSLYGYINPEYINSLLNKLINNPEEANKILKTAFGNSDYLKELLDPKSELRNILSINRFSYIRRRGSREKPLEFKTMSKTARELTKLWAFQNQGNKTGYIFDLTYSDKSRTNLIHIPKVDTLNWKDINSDAFKKLKNLLISEINRIKETQQTQPSKNNISNYHTEAEAGKLAFLFPKLYEVKDSSGNPILTREGLSDNYLKNPEQFNEQLNNVILESVTEWINNKIKILKQHKINFNLFDHSYLYGKKKLVEKLINTSEENIFKEAITDYVINRAITIGNIIQIIHGDIALAGKKGAKTEGYIRNTLINYFKRLAKTIAPGIETPLSDIVSSVKVLYVNDVKVENEYSKETKSDPIVSTDSQAEFTTKFYITFLYSRGWITKKLYNSILDKIENHPDDYDSYFNDEENKVIFQSGKPVYVGNNIINGINNVTYIKFSSYPLLPSVVKGRNKDKIRKKLEQNNIDFLVYKSAVKLGFRNGIDIYKKGNLDINDNLTDNIIELDPSGFRIQQDNPIGKQKIIFASQVRKLLFSDFNDIKFIYREKEISQLDLENLFNENFGNLVSEKFNSLIEEFGLEKTRSGYMIIDLSKFQNFLTNNAKDRINSWDIHDLQIFNLSEDKQNFRIPLIYAPQPQKIESLLTSIFNHHIIRQNFPGISYIQASSTGYETEEKNVFSDPALKYMQKDKTGYYSEIAIPWIFDPELYNEFVNSDGTPKTELFEPETLYIIGYRIPYSGHNLNGRFKIVKFLNPLLKDIALIPSEILLQMNSDFDVDKLNTYQWNYSITKDGIKKYKFNEQAIRNAYKNKGDKITDKLLNDIFSDVDSYFTENDEENIQKLIKKAKQKELENNIIEILHSIYSNSEVIKYVKQPLSTKLLEETINKILKITKENTKKQFNILEDELSDQIFNDNKAGSLLRALSSLSVTNHALSQKNKLFIKKIPILFKNEKGIFNEIKTETDETNYPLHSNGLYKLDKIYDINGNLISTNYNNILQAGLDNANNPLLGFGNINGVTHSVIDLLIGVGLPLDIITFFMRQESIVSLVKDIEEINNPERETYQRLTLKQVGSKLLLKYINLGDFKPTKIEAFSSDELYNLLEEGTKSEIKTKSYYKNQAQILYNFLQWQSIGEERIDLKRAISPEASGIGKSVIESNFKQRKLDTIFNFLGNTENFFDENSLVGKILKLGLIEANKVTKNLFPYSTDSYQTVYDEIQSNMKSSISIKLNNEINNDIRNFIFSGLLSIDNLEKERERLLIDSFKYIEGEKVFIKKSLAQRISEYKGTNKFLKKLTTDLTFKSGYPSYILYNTTVKDESYEGLENSKHWLDALNSINEEEREIAEDLFKYTYIFTGTVGKNSIMKYVPIQYLEDQIISKNKNGFIDFSNPFALSNFKRQYFQHRAWRATQFDLKETIFDKEKLYKDIPLSIKIMEDGNLEKNIKITDHYPEFISTKVGRNYGLFELIGKKVDEDDFYITYKRINLLGGSNIKEYNVIQELNESVLPDNNIPQNRITDESNKGIESNMTPSTTIELPDKLNKESAALKTIEQPIKTKIEKKEVSLSPIETPIKEIISLYPETSKILRGTSKIDEAIRNNDIETVFKEIISDNNIYSPLAKFLLPGIKGVTIEERELKGKAYGLQIENSISIDINMHRNKLDLYSTILHESIHTVIEEKIDTYNHLLKVYNEYRKENRTKLSEIYKDLTE